MGNIWGFPDAAVWQHKFRHVQKYILCIGVLLCDIWSVVGLSVHFWWSIRCHCGEDISDVVCPLICMHSHRGLSHQTPSPGGLCWWGCQSSHGWHRETLSHTQIQTSGQFKVSVTLQRPKHDCRISRWRRKNLSSCFQPGLMISDCLHYPPSTLLLLVMPPKMLWSSFFAAGRSWWIRNRSKFVLVHLLRGKHGRLQQTDVCMKSVLRL